MPEPGLGWRFEIAVDGLTLDGFTQCEGLNAEYEVYEYEEGGQNGFVHKLTGRLKYSPIKLTRPVDSTSSLLATWFASLQGVIVERTAMIRVYDANSKQVASWNLEGVVPIRWTGPSFSTSGAQIATETIELAHTGFIGGAAGGAGASIGASMGLGI